MADDWVMWQLADSAFPTGGFAHSNGLEAAWQHGLVKDGDSLSDFIKTGLRQTLLGSFGFVNETWKDPSRFAEVDSKCDLFLNNPIANRASRSQGRAFLLATGRAFANEAISKLATEVRQQNCPTHAAPVFGVVCMSLQLSEAQTKKLWIFLFVRNCISSAVRLGIGGPLEAQQIQNKLPLEKELGVKRSAGMAVQTSPVLDLLQGTQDRLYSKLFQS